jgi:RNA polymerase sigma-70 factor, ECF subfamily
VPAAPDRDGDADARTRNDRHDLDLMMAVRAGSAAAFDAIVQRYWEPTARYALHLVRDLDLASDVTQEAFTRLWQRRGQWESRGSVLVWLLRTTRHLVVSDARKRSVRTRWAVFARQEPPAHPRTPLQELERTELRDAIRLALNQLSPRRREVFVLFHMQGLSYREIAEVMGVRTQTVANYLQAAVTELRCSLSRSRPEPSAVKRPG